MVTTTTSPTRTSDGQRVRHLRDMVLRRRIHRTGMGTRPVRTDLAHPAGPEDPALLLGIVPVPTLSTWRGGSASKQRRRALGPDDAGPRRKVSHGNHGHR